MLNFREQRVLILAPHADDETIGCGGVIQKYRNQNSAVRVVIASFVMGATAKYHSGEGRYETYSGVTRLAEVQKAFQVLGVNDFHFLYRDEAEPGSYHSHLDRVPRHELVEKIEHQLLEFKPTILYIPSVTKHQDHEALHKAALTAARPYFWNESIIVYETDGEFVFQPNCFVELEEREIRRKAEALSQFKTQLGSIGHPTTPDFMLVKAQYRGQSIFVNYAEAFQILRLHA